MWIIICFFARRRREARGSLVTGFQTCALPIYAWGAPWSAEGEAGSPDPRLAALGRRWIAPADGEAAGYDERRIALGVPEGAAELGVDKTLWLEANAVELNGVSFSKGCYVGQENTNRKSVV